MTWTRLDDNWDEDPVFDALDYDVRWHLTGHLPSVKALLLFPNPNERNTT